MQPCLEHKRSPALNSSVAMKCGRVPSFQGRRWRPVSGCPDNLPCAVSAAGMHQVSDATLAVDLHLFSSTSLAAAGGSLPAKLLAWANSV